MGDHIHRNALLKDQGMRERNNKIAAGQSVDLAAVANEFGVLQAFI